MSTDGGSQPDADQDGRINPYETSGGALNYEEMMRHLRSGGSIYRFFAKGGIRHSVLIGMAAGGGQVRRVPDQEVESLINDGRLVFVVRESKDVARWRLAE